MRLKVSNQPQSLSNFRWCRIQTSRGAKHSIVHTKPCSVGLGCQFAPPRSRQILSKFRVTRRVWGEIRKTWAGSGSCDNFWFRICQNPPRCYSFICMTQTSYLLGCVGPKHSTAKTAKPIPWGKVPRHLHWSITPSHHITISRGWHLRQDWS